MKIQSSSRSKGIDAFTPSLIIPDISAAILWGSTFILAVKLLRKKPT